MSARAKRVRINVVLLLCVLVLTTTAAHARDWADALATPFVDPLRTRPERLERLDLLEHFNGLAGAVQLPGELSAGPCPVDAGAGANQMLELTLEQAVNVALCRNPQVRGTWAAIKVQAAAVGEARAAYWPTLSASTSRIRDRMSYPDSSLPGTEMYSSTIYVNLNWRLFDFGTRGANQHAANALLDEALANQDALLQKSLSAVIGAYFDAQTGLAAWQARQKNEELAGLTLGAAQRRQAGGAGSQSDTLQANTAFAKAKLERSRAHGNYKKAISVLVYALGVPTGSVVTLAQDLHDQQDNLQQELEQWIAQAQAQHPSLIAARAQLQAAQEKVTATQAEGLPTLDLMANQYENGRPNQGLTSSSTKESVVGVTLNIPLFEGFARTYKVRGAQAQVEQKTADLQDAEHQILMEVVKTHADATSALENLDASASLLEAAQATLVSMQRKFDKGVADMLEVLSTQVALSDAQQQRIQCQAEWRSARLRLLAATGVLGRSMLGSN
jgi:outer membrane protein